ncbi:DedA family protein [Utexia brackfieldae]|uniref:DedA family protein n=1 Tax=Utexia brackfieldae TaxID=3074108 RepID=UPI00370CFF93
MDTILSLYEAFKSLDYTTLSDPSVLWILYSMLFVILFLENGVLPAAFLPGDSLLFITGILISLDIFHFGLINVVLIAGGACGTWLGYIQGRWLGKTKMVQNWMGHLPTKYHQRAEVLFHKYGLAALFIGRFIPFVRTLLPMLAGLSGLKNIRFHIFNWLSATLWIFLITTAGYLFGLSPLFKAYEKQFMTLFMLIPVFLLVLGLIASLWVVLRRWAITKRAAAKQDKH